MVEEDLHSVLEKQMYSLIRRFIDQLFVLVSIDDILLLSHTKSDMMEITEQLQQISKLNNFKIASEEPFYMLLTFTILGHEVGNQTVRPIHSKVEAMHKCVTSTSKRELMIFLGNMNSNQK